MTDREERQHVIKVLQKMVDWMEAINYIVATPERRYALYYAIASIKTDLKYDLLYEETLEEEPKPMVEIDLYSVIKQKYIEREVLDKIRADIQFIKDKCLPNNIAEEYEQKGLQEALDIIDMYKAETER